MPNKLCDLVIQRQGYHNHHKMILDNLNMLNIVMMKLTNKNKQTKALEESCISITLKFALRKRRSYLIFSINMASIPLCH